MTQLPVYSELADCHACPLCLHRKRVAMPLAAAPWANRVMAVGSWPTQVEDQKGLAFTDPYRAKVLYGFLEAAGLDPVSVYKTYRVKCRPGENKEPEGIEAEVCLTWLKYELIVNKPLLVIAFGTATATWFYSKFEPSMYGRILCCNNEQLLGYINPVFKRLHQQGHKRTVWPHLGYGNPKFNWRGPVVVPVRDLDEMTAPRNRKGLAKQLRRLKEVVEITAGMPPLWSAALMRGEDPETDDED